MYDNRPKEVITWTLGQSGQHKRYKVNGLSGSLSKQTIFVWKAPPDSDITIFFPPYRDPLRIGTQTIKAGEELLRRLPEDFQEMPQPSPRRIYRYAIYTDSTGTFAEMNSDPEVIIDE
ncbi:MAG: hypothetical protein A2X67_03515 [Ignavibacteria bacterium GWA2_55_11]|nr:MAG: hypothetical protein A2X67_03515 [Ignavibacteria bacterium GWA2_55_11]